MKKRNHPEDNQPKNVPWEIDRTEKKKIVLRIIFLILAVAAAIYMCIGIYFGLTGKNEYFQYEFWSVAFRKVWVHPRWFLHSVALCCAWVLYADPLFRNRTFDDRCAFIDLYDNLYRRNVCYGEFARKDRQIAYI